MKKGIYARYIKRILDVVCAALFILIFFWLYVLIAILVRIKLGSPVIFRQERPGKNEKIFTMYKLRTMTDEHGADGKLLDDEVRLTSFGRFLRKTSLDELPELFNIVKGDMSIVGPRPLLVSYLPWYTDEEKHRHDVRPGLTGWAQVNGRNFVDWDYRLAMDAEYVRDISLLFDVKIIFKTISAVLKRSDIAEDTHRIEGNLAEIRSSR